MSRRPPRRTVLRFAASAVVASVAGCTADTDIGATSSQSRTDSPTPEPTLTPTPEETESPTPEPIGTGNNPSDVHLGNGSEATRTVTLRLDEKGGATVFDETYELETGERVELDVFDTDAPGRTSSRSS